jgi:hypothetical protein
MKLIHQQSSHLFLWKIINPLSMLAMTAMKIRQLRQKREQRERDRHQADAAAAREHRVMLAQQQEKAMQQALPSRKRELGNQWVDISESTSHLLLTVGVRDGDLLYVEGYPYAKVESFQSPESSMSGKLQVSYLRSPVNISFDEICKSMFRDCIERINYEKKIRFVCESLSREGKEPPHEFICPITMEVMIDPVLASDKLSYERHAIDRWFKSSCRSPLTNCHLPNKLLRKNEPLRANIAAWTELRLCFIPREPMKCTVTQRGAAGGQPSRRAGKRPSSKSSKAATKPSKAESVPSEPTPSDQAIRRARAAH